MSSKNEQCIRTNKKVLFIHHSGYIGGAGVSLMHILKGLNQLPFDLTVYCPNIPNDMINQIKNLGIETISSPNSIQIIEHFAGCDRSIFNYKTLRNLINITRNKKEIEKLIKSISPDIVVVNSMTLSYIGRIAKSIGVKTVCFHRETYAKGLFGIRTKYIKKYLSNDFDKVVFISNHDLRKSGNMKSKNYVIRDKVILNEFTNSKFVNLSLPEEAIKVLYTGGMSHLKGAHIIIKALAKSKTNIHLMFLQYGDIKRKKGLSDYSGIKNRLRYLLGKDYTAKVLSLIDKHGLWNRVHFFPTTSDVAKYFKACDFVAFPSTSAHQARPIYEAGASKKPIIITHSKNIEEFVIEGENGFTFNNGDTVKLATFLDKLSMDKELRILMGNKNYEMTIANHDFSNLQQELIEVFDM
jgi:glycosyltransferase involved in cell wall biosynthesis